MCLSHVFVAFSVLFLLNNQQPTPGQSGSNVAGLVEQLKHSDPDVRLKAVDALAAVPEQAADAIPMLRDLYLSDPIENVRRRARTVCGAIKVATRGKTGLPAPAAPIEGIGNEGIGNADGAGGNTPAPASEEATGRLAELIKQLKASPDASITASDELGRMGAEAKPACSALVETMMTPGVKWHDARLAAAEALEKIHPKLQQAVLKVILTPETEITPAIIGFSELGTDGRGALPLLMYLWSLDVRLGLHQTGALLDEMHAVAPTEKVVTDQIVGVVRGKVPAGFQCYLAALEILDQRGLPDEEVADHYLAVLQTPGIEAALIGIDSESIRLNCLQRLQAMVNSNQVKPEKVLRTFIACLNLNAKDFGLRSGALNALGEIGPPAKEAVPLIRRLKFEDPDERIREAAAAALLGIEK